MITLKKIKPSIAKLTHLPNRSLNFLQIQDSGIPTKNQNIQAGLINLPQNSAEPSLPWISAIAELKLPSAKARIAKLKASLSNTAGYLLVSPASFEFSF